MSRVTNVMLSVVSDDQTNAEEFSRWLKERCPIPETPAEKDEGFWPADLYESSESRRERLARGVADGVGSGRDVEDVLAGLWAERTNLVDVILAVRSGLGVDIGAAREAVLTSPTWRDYAAAHTDYLAFAEETLFKGLDQKEI